MAAGASRVKYTSIEEAFEEAREEEREREARREAARAQDLHDWYEKVVDDVKVASLVREIDTANPVFAVVMQCLAIERAGQAIAEAIKSTKEQSG